MVQKLNRIKVEEKLKSMGISVFGPREFRDIFIISTNTASTFITRNLQSGLFVKLRNGFYTLQDSNPSLYLIANKMYQPSYISLEKALSHYGIIPETVYTITSVTTKSTREFTSSKGVFSYQHIKQCVFTGYSPMRFDGTVVLFASPEKALADYLYFVDLKRVSLNDRLSLRVINKKKLIETVKIFNRSGMIKLINHIYAEQRKPRTIY
ncbi:MAG: hypothetical protein Q7S16_04555 [bacterium]|nr:hypothetical protein [bacterium]